VELLIRARLSSARLYTKGMAVLIVKADGESEPFNSHKLRESLLRSGADHDVVSQVESELAKELYSGMTTQELYRRAFARLRAHRREVAARYSLKRAILDFGPSGFPFEAYLGELFRAEGWDAAIDQIVPGTCVEHEVDVVLTKGSEVVYVEAKFHNTAGYKSDLKTALYVKARMDDIAAYRKAKGTPGTMRGLLVTNTKFTSQAVQFADCAGVELLGWEEPTGKTLQDRIDAVRLYPITALTSLTHRQKMALLEQRVVLAQNLQSHKAALHKAGVPKASVPVIIEEARALCASGEGLQ